MDYLTLWKALKAIAIAGIVALIVCIVLTIIILVTTRI